MPKKIVTTEPLNFRETPEFADNIIGTLHLTQEVNVINAPAGERFWEIEAKLNGQTRRGFAGSRFLREPLSAPKEKLMREAFNEWVFFERGQGQENVDPFFRRVGDYWQAININFDGRDAVPWSAAFISFIARRADYTGFKFSDSHDKYILDAKAMRLANDASAPFWLFRLSEHKPQLGDLVCMWRVHPRTFDNLPSEFKSHTDVIVEITNDVVKTLGGNVSDSVTRKTFNLRNDGFLKSEQKLFAIMRNNR
ncbi:MAG: DUF2272 domain-containing protein [Blastocatellia bacterium]